MPITTIEWKNNCVRIIDQTKLPLKLEYLDCRNIKTIWKAIKELKVRGAPAIGIAGALGVVLGAKNIKTASFDIFQKELDKIISYLDSSRPTAVNLAWALKRMRKITHSRKNLPIAQTKELLLIEALKILDEDKQICRKMADYGANLIQNNDTCLTICNAGALATADYGTALGVFYRAKEKGKSFKVFACETRPLLQGARLTSWELKKHQIDSTLIADNTAGYLMKEGKINKVFAGADRIARNGDTANKIGTFNLALLSHYHKIPFYIVAPASSFDLSIKSKKNIPIEHRDPAEVLNLHTRRIAPRGLKVYNPAFDVTLNNLISAFITEKGIIYPPYHKNIKSLLGTPRVGAGFKPAPTTELNLIQMIAKKIGANPSVVRGIGDDTAVLKYTRNKYQLFTCDMLIEGADFFPHTAAKDVGHKALACSLSDIAAMGGRPKYALISLGLPRKQAKEFISGFYKGALALAGKFKTNIVGGDLSLSEKIIVDVSMIGEVLKKNLTLRSGAKPGDLIFVSGSLGGSLYSRHLRFTPRIKEANYLVSNYRISAMMDLSDGLSLDLHRLTSASKVGAIIHEELIPVSHEAKSLTEALNMGEDYELLFTVQPEEAKRLIKNNPFFKIIGEIREEKYGLKIIAKDGREKILEPKGYQHF